MKKTSLKSILGLKIVFFISLTFLLIPFCAFSQVQNVIVEKYYVADANDAADTTGGVLEEGSTTYRVYVDLKPGCKLRKIYGDANHALQFSSTSFFFNNKIDGQSFGKDFPKTRLLENSVALDSWLTLGQTTRAAAKTYYGVLKTQDRDGSFIGGINNDLGLLANRDTSAGIPLTNADGMDTMLSAPVSWADYGIRVNGIDTTIFGSVKVGSRFVSYGAGLQNSGVTGVFQDSNQVLVAQLTTKGELSFEINLEIEEPGVPFRVKYVAKFAAGETNSDSLKQSRFLKYPPDPPVCGCTDPDFLEYNASYECANPDSCLNRIVFGCTDPLACNYNPDANFNIPELCCYPGYCNDRDLEVVCPSLVIGERKFRIFPNPAQDRITMEVTVADKKETTYAIFNSFGRMVLEKNLGIASGIIAHDVDISLLEKGLYLFQLMNDGQSESKLFIKN